LVLLDFSAVIHGYRADFANTFACGAWATPKQRDMFLACIDAMDAGEQNLRPGVSGRTVYEAVCQSFAANHYAESFPHHAGHGIGLGHPEAPFLVPASADVLLPGDVLTLEPGLYVPGVGGMRFERNYLITEHGPTVLTRHELSLDTAQP
jgi:Xaa-Pro aminopeptidase